MPIPNTTLARTEHTIQTPLLHESYALGSTFGVALIRLHIALRGSVMNSIFLRLLGEKFFYVLKKQCGKLSGFCAGCIGDRPFGLRGWLFHQYRVHNDKSAVFERVVCMVVSGVGIHFRSQHQVGSLILICDSVRNTFFPLLQTRLGRPVAFLLSPIFHFGVRFCFFSSESYWSNSGYLYSLLCI